MPKKKIIQLGIILLLAIIALRFFFTPFKCSPSKGQPFIVRVRVAHDANKLELGTSSECEVSDAKTGKLLKKEEAIPEGTEVLSVASGIKLGNETFAARAIRVSSSGGGLVDLNGTLYRGEMDIIKTDKGFDAVNRVGLEDYLKGVVPREVSHLWPFEVIKAQAIASRSFAAYEAMRRKNKEYDLTADTFSQVYGGQSSERWRTTRAVEDTEGKVLEYKGKVFPAYFHSCCGGHTQDISRVWNEDLPPLKGIKCSWCRWSPHFRWQARVPTRTILENLNKDGYQITNINDIREGQRDDSGRLEYLSIKSSNKWFEITTGDFRNAISKKILKSANFRVKKYPFFYLFSGYGWGHGVGMCQWGAFGLGLRRWSAGRILRQYYPGTEIVDLKNIP
ncbi:MAG: SpoIID/LytB domain-containing protein [Candidatus Omnitrophota bacterium]